MLKKSKIFTIHFATINTSKTNSHLDYVEHLQYTLLLLIPEFVLVDLIKSEIYNTLCYY